MKITIGGSMAFAKEQVEVKKELERRGYDVFLTDNIEKYVNFPEIKQEFEDELETSLENNIMMSFFKKIEKSDALLICNYEKNGIKGYLGTSVLMEIGLAYYLDKKIYLLNDIDTSQGYALEIAIIKPTIVNGDLAKLL